MTKNESDTEGDGRSFGLRRREVLAALTAATATSTAGCSITINGEEILTTSDADDGGGGGGGGGDDTAGRPRTLVGDEAAAELAALDTGPKIDHVEALDGGEGHLRYVMVMENGEERPQHKIGGKAKAMIVTSSRAHAVRYKKSIDEYIQENGYDLNALVAFSGTVEDDGSSYTEKEMNGGIKESELPNVFDTPEYQVLVVADKYQTGFDQPLLHTMYVDKKLSGIQAVQTLSRLNRQHPGKEDTFVLDFENEQEEIKEAFEPFYGKTTVTEEMDPQHLQQLASELDAFRIYEQEEVDRFAKVFFDPSNTGTEGAHGKLSSIVQPARDRFVAKEEEIQEDFRSTLRSFLRLYKFQSQIVSYADTHLEKLYTFGRFLYKELPRQSHDPTVEFDDELALQYYRLEKSEEGSIGLSADDGEVEGPTETGTGGSEADDEVELSTIVEKINEKLGTDFTEADQLFLEQLKEDALEDDHLRRSARANSRENFALEFDDALTSMFIDRMDQNQELFAEFMDNDEVQEAITKHLRQQVYRESQSE